MIACASHAEEKVALPIPDRRAAVGLILFLACLCWNSIAQLCAEWSLNEQYSYGWLVPVLSAYLILLRWPSLPEPQPPKSATSGLVALSALLLALLPIRIFQEANPDWRPVSWMVAIHSVSAVSVIVYLVGGAGWLRHLIFPLGFFLVSVPWVGPIERMIVNGLMSVNTSISTEFLNLLGIYAVQRGNVIDLMPGSVGVNEACSGIRSVQSSVMLSLFLGEYRRLRIPQRFLLLAMALGLVLIVNVCRTATLCLVANTSGVGALERCHDSIGLAMSIVILAALFLMANLLDNDAMVESGSGFPVAVNLSGMRLPNWILSAAALVWMGAVLAINEMWYRAHESDIRQSTRWTVAWPKSLESYREHPIDDGSQIELRFNEGQHSEWRSGPHKWEAFLFRWHPGRNAAQLASNHNPLVCLPSTGMNLVTDFGVRNIRTGDLVIPFRAFQFSAEGRPVLVFYCLWEDVVRAQAQEALREDKSPMSRLLAAREGKRHLGQQVLQAAVWDSVNLEEAETALAQIVTPVDLSRP